MKNTLDIRKTVEQLNSNCISINNCLNEIKTKINSKDSILSTGKRTLKK